ncbi:MAG: DUF4385 domain-containing protein [Hyphomicrobiales bacterium]|nr:DUF4385 domain-containing protein [Hyphomicrobiales bacterium]
MPRKPSYLNFDKASYAWKPDIDYRSHPEHYRIGRGEQGVLICQPYKDELVPLWRFKTPGEAEESSKAIWRKFQEYLSVDDFVGADMARKFLQMGFTRARRYTNYKGGRKYAGSDHKELERGTGDPQKAQCATIFYERWKAAEADQFYASAKAAWKREHG